MNTKLCDCGRTIDRWAGTCPFCGKTYTSPLAWVGLVLVIPIVVIFIIYCLTLLKGAR